MHHGTHAGEGVELGWREASIGDGRSALGSKGLPLDEGRLVPNLGLRYCLEQPTTTEEVARMRERGVGREAIPYGHKASNIRKIEIGGHQKH